MEVWEAVQAQEDEHLRCRVEKSIASIDRTIELYGASGVAFSFNGGKDSTVLLHLLRAAVALRSDSNSSDTSGLGGMTTFFFHNDADFQDITDFTHGANEQYGLAMEVLRGDFKGGLEDLLSRTPIKAIFLGTRRGDPNAPGQETFCPSSKGWPPFMRVNPILDWTYHDVWAFLRCASVPYCRLYDQGYTSVGSVGNTAPNAALLREDGTYAPAHLLPDARLERAGRVSNNGSVKRSMSLVGPDICTAGLLIIGDEILSAKVEDLNTRFLCAELRAIGWRVDRVVCIRDDVDAIAAEVRALSDAHDAVLTAGGLGPTLDDVTMRGVAEALGRQLTRHADLETRIRAFFDGDVTEAHLKMAEVPTGSEVALMDYQSADGKLAPFPLVRCRNVYVLPGVPSLVQQKWRAVRDDLLSRCKEGSSPFQSIVLRLQLSDEAVVAAALEQVASGAGGSVAVGSYPVKGQSDGCEVVLSLESKDMEKLEEARGKLVELLPPGVVASEHRNADKALNSPAEAPTLDS